MSIRNRIAGYLFGRAYTVQEVMTHPEIGKDEHFLSQPIDDSFRKVETKTFNCDASFRKMGQSCTPLNTIGVPSMWSNECRAYAPVVAPIEQDWKCPYCGCIRPHTEYKCGYCGAPRKGKEETKTVPIQSNEWEPDESQIGSVDL